MKIDGQIVISAVKVIQKQVHNGNKHEQNKSIKTPNLQSKLREKAAF